MLLRVFGWIIIAQVILSWLMAFNVINMHAASSGPCSTGSTG